MEWQPISTAPKDGTSILVCRGHMIPWMAHWVKMTRVPDRWESYGEGAIPFSPTHWMLLPEPPEDPPC